MERLKLPAGRLATVFYKSEPQDLATRDASTNSDVEKGSLEEDLPPVIAQRSRRSVKASQELLDRKGHSFAWKSITLDIRTRQGHRRLLDDVNGKLLCSGEMPEKMIEPWNRLDISGSDDGSNGRVWSWKGLISCVNIASST